MAPAQLVVFTEKQVGECVTPAPSEERKWSQKGHAPCVCTSGERSKHFIEEDEPCASLFRIEVSRTLALPEKACPCCACACGKGQSVLLRT